MKEEGDSLSTERSKNAPVAIVRTPPTRFINIYSYTALLSVVQFWYTFHLAYTVAAITSLERRYGMPSLYSGIFLASFEIGHLTIIIFSFTETNCHIPRRLALRGCFMSIGALLIASTHIFVPVATRPGRDISRSFESSSSSSLEALTCFDTTLTSESLRNCTLEEIKEDLTEASQGAGEAIRALVILTLAQGIVATASATYCVIGLLYIDNNVPKHRSSTFIGTVYGTMMLGPAAAFFFSSGIASSIYVHPFESNPPDPNSSHFVGAWWSGFLLSSFMFMAVSPVLLLFPHSFSEHSNSKLEPASGTTSKNSTIRSEITVDSHCDSQSASKSLIKKEDSSVLGTLMSSDVEEEPFTLKSLPQNFVILFRNTVFLALVFLACAQMYITAGYFTFFPKYIEAQFNQPVWVANLVSGIVNPIPCALGTFLGGFLMSKLQLKQSHALLSTLILVTTVAIGLLFMTGLQCQPEPVVGMSMTAGKGLVINTEVAGHCNSKCNSCPPKFDPICGSDGLTFVSPCHAGCQFYNLEDKLYSQCECIQSGNVSIFGSAVPEKCQPSSFLARFCDNFFIYTVMAFILAILVILPSTPLTVIMMRTVGPRYKSWAIGLTSSFCSFLSFIPAPVIYGSVFDSQCLLWDEKSSEKIESGSPRCNLTSFEDDNSLLSFQNELLSQQSTPRNCILYETKSLSVWFHVLTSTFLFISLPANAYVWWKIRENEIKTEDVVGEESYKTVEQRHDYPDDKVTVNELTTATEFEMSNQRMI